MLATLIIFLKEIILTENLTVADIREKALTHLLRLNSQPEPPAPPEVYISPAAKIGTKVTITLWSGGFSEMQVSGMPGKANTYTYSPTGSMTVIRPIYNEICNLLARNRKIEAIKTLRVYFDSLGLKEAKDTVDKWDFTL